MISSAQRDKYRIINQSATRSRECRSWPARAQPLPLIFDSDNCTHLPSLPLRYKIFKLDRYLPSPGDVLETTGRGGGQFILAWIHHSPPTYVCSSHVLIMFPMTFNKVEYWTTRWQQVCKEICYSILYCHKDMNWSGSRSTRCFRLSCL